VNGKLRIRSRFELQKTQQKPRSGEIFNFLL
jgi:hypothetical protein